MKNNKLFQSKRIFTEKSIPVLNFANLFNSGLTGKTARFSHQLECRRRYMLFWLKYIKERLISHGYVVGK